MSIVKVTAPFDGRELGSLPLMDAESAFAALQVAYETYNSRDRWLKPYERIAILEKVVIMLSERKNALARIAASEGGKPLADSLIEAERAVEGVKAAIIHLRVRHGVEVPMNITKSSKNRMAFTFHEPVGVVLALSAFNHPLNLIIHQVIPAISAGCPVLIKPATKTPLSCDALIKILYEAGLPENWCQMIMVKHDVAEKLVADPRIGFLSFIGSSEVGWYLRSKLPAGADCALEHGGAAPVIVENDADIDAALPLLLKGGMYHAGQVCVSVQRVFVHQKIAKNFAKQLADLARELKVGDPEDSSTEVGPIISKRNVARIDEWVRQAVYKGAKLYCGGTILTPSLYAPTILFEPTDEVKVSTSEIFGPVICVYSYRDRLEAIQRANQLPFVFQSSVFSNDLNATLDTVKRLNATTVLVNDHTAFRVDWMPFGGRKQSGLGVGGIPYSIDELSYQKMMVFNAPCL